MILNSIYFLKLRNHKMIFHNLLLICIFSLVYKYIAMNYGNEQDKKKFDSYENCFYFTIVTQFSVGYGDIVPSSDAMKCVSIIHILLVFLILALY